MDCRGKTTKCIGNGIFDLCLRNSSLTKRLDLFLYTALPSLLVAITPNLLLSEPTFITCIQKGAVFNEKPRDFTSRNSLVADNLSARERKKVTQSTGR